jgi:tRNA(adenine34) deaminase
MMKDDVYYMQLALAEAKKARELHEVPIGAVIVINGAIIAMRHNLRESEQNAVAHAELLAIQDACKEMGTWRLEDATLYVTLEPCPMCAGAILQSRVKRVVFGAHDPKAGCAGTFMNLLQDDRFNHQCDLETGVLKDECSRLLSDFFKHLRKKKKVEKHKRSSFELDIEEGIDKG